MRQLVIDTATEALSVALFADDGALLAHHHEIAGRGHAEKLVPVIAAMDGGGRAGEIWVDKGPGSFTGIRVGLAAARALAYAWNASIYSYSSITLVAAMAREASQDPGETITIAITGGHGELFWQSFNRTSLSPVTQAASTPIDQLAQQINAPVIYGSGALALVEARGYGEAVAIHPDARMAPLIPAALIDKNIMANYGRGADARPLVARNAVR